MIHYERIIVKHMGVVLGIDYGEKRIGVAVSDDTGTIAVPSCILTPASRDELLDECEHLAREKNAERVIVGLPYALAGTATAQTHVVERFIEALAQRLTIPVDAVDERLTSVEARHGGGGEVDARAAALLLQSYLDQKKNSTS